MASDGIPKNAPTQDLAWRNVSLEPHLYFANFAEAEGGLHKIRNPKNLLQDSHSILDNSSGLCQSFSIREYVGKVRSVNIRKCWPLSESLLEERLKEGREPLLPSLKSPISRWWACQHSLDNDGKHTHIGSIGTAFGRQPIPYATEQSNINDRDANIEKQLTVSLGSSQVYPSISQDLEEQIKKPSSVQISMEDEDVFKINEEERRVHSTEDRAEDNLQTYLRPSENQTINCTVLKLLENQSLTGKSDADMHKARRVKTVGQNHPPTRLASLELKGSKTVNHGSETVKLESVKYGISGISKAEGSGLKICPVCKTFSSTTVTAVNAHMDDCLAQACKQEKRQCKSQKKKSRTSKKRSITDIFAAAPRVQIALKNVQNNERDESGGSEGMDICSDDARDSIIQKENSGHIETGSEAAVCDEQPSLNCKRKKPTEGRSPVESEKTDNGQMKRKRKRCGIISSVSTANGIKEARTPSAVTDVMDKDHSVANHLKLSTIIKEVPDGQEQTMQLTCMQRDLAENKQHSPTMLSTEHKAKEGSVSNSIPLAPENGRLIREDITEEPLSILTIASAPGAVSHLYVMQNNAIPRNVAYQSQNNFNILENNECRHDKEDSPNSSTLQVGGGPKPHKPDLLNFSRENSGYKEVASLNPNNIGDNERFKGTNSKSKCSLVLLVDEKQPLMPADNSEQKIEQLRSKAVENKNTQSYASHQLGDVSNSESVQAFDCSNEKWNALCLQKERQCFETRKGTKDQSIRHTGLNLNQKACVLPRDSGGRFVSSSRKNEEKERKAPYPPWKQSQRHKSTKAQKPWANTSSVHNETNFSLDVSFSNARYGKATSLQTFFPDYRNHHCREEPSLTQEVPSSYDYVKTLSKGRRSLLPNVALRPVEAHSSVNTINLVKFCTPKKSSDYGYVGLPLDSQGELVKHLPSTKPVVTQVFRTPDYMTVNNPLFTECTKMPQEFSFLETIKTSQDVTAVNGPLQTVGERKQTHHWQEYLTSNQPKHDRMCSEQSFQFDQTQRDKTYCGSSHSQIAGSSKWTSDTRSNARPWMQTCFESGYNADQIPKALVSEKTYAEVQNTRREQPTTQPVMRLMGKSFTISGESEAGNALNDSQQGNRNATTGVSSAYMDYCRTRNKRQFDLPDYGVDDLCQHSGGKVNVATDHSSVKTSHSQSIVMDEVTTINKDEGMMLENRLTDCTHHGLSLNDQSISAQVGMPTPSFCAQKLPPSVSYLSTNKGMNEVPNLRCQDSHISGQGWLARSQSYSELLSYLEKESFHKRDIDSCPIQRHTHQSLQSPSFLGPLSDLFHGTSCAPTHSTSMPAKTSFNYQTTSSTYAPERPNMALDLPKKNGNKFKSRREQGKLIDIVNLERECRDDLRTRESIDEIQGLHRKWSFEKHEDSAAGQNQKCDAISTPYEQHKGKKAFQEMSCFSIDAKHANSIEILKNNMMDSSNAGSSFQFAEPRKLSGGAKHILKPSFECGNGKQSLTLHHTLPFGEDRSK